MAAGKLRINVGKTFQFEDTSEKFFTGGDIQDTGMRLQYHNASGQTVAFGDVLYTEGTPGATWDYFEIRSDMNGTLNGSGLLSVRVYVQYNIPVGTSKSWNISILGSETFTFTAFS